jgi:hypothetical protein
MEDSTLSEALLQDIREVFAARAKNGMPDADRIFSKDLCEELAKIESGPWAEFGQKEKPITPTQLARLLKGYGIESKQQKIAGENRNGYAKSDFIEAWQRYLDEDVHTQPDSAISRVYRVYQPDSKEVDTDFVTLPHEVGRVSNEALKLNGINAVDSVESQNGGNGDSAKGVSSSPEPCLPFSGAMSQCDSDYMEPVRKFFKAKREKEAGKKVTVTI